MANPIVTITMENGDVMKAELYPEIAPITVENFVNLVKDGFYDGLTFHRIINGFMIQGGCPLGTGTGGPGHTIKGEFSQNGVINNLKHTPGVLSMARSMMPDSAGSQFFIMHKNSPHLDGSYAAFGKVIEGMDEIWRLEKVKTRPVDFPIPGVEVNEPVEPEVIEKVELDLKLQTYPEPIRMKVQNLPPCWMDMR